MIQSRFCETHSAVTEYDLCMQQVFLTICKITTEPGEPKSCIFNPSGVRMVQGGSDIVLRALQFQI
ncbi:hypothetical protein SAMN05216388_1003327 [Halorientalis persicus]|uniref:Uncharacterized protein n=1 Tax=Halorientalis persicus TaxID=1367881 RepID=A0A1H8HB75_9EURY|nr:hypothetical protein SAMN05216388_1003327 [Halorientalis persicus]